VTKRYERATAVKRYSRQITRDLSGNFVKYTISSKYVETTGQFCSTDFVCNLFKIRRFQIFISGLINYDFWWWPFFLCHPVLPRNVTQNLNYKQGNLRRAYWNLCTRLSRNTSCIIRHEKWTLVLWAVTDFSSSLYRCLFYLMIFCKDSFKFTMKLANTCLRYGTVLQPWNN